MIAQDVSGCSACIPKIVITGVLALQLTAVLSELLNLYDAISQQPSVNCGLFLQHTPVTPVVSAFGVLGVVHIIEGNKSRFLEFASIAQSSVGAQTKTGRKKNKSQITTTNNNGIICKAPSFVCEACTKQTWHAKNKTKNIYKNIQKKKKKKKSKS